MTVDRDDDAPRARPGGEDPTERLEVLSALMEHAHAGLIVLDSGGTILEVNRYALAMFGGDRSRIEGRHFLELVDERSADAARDGFADLSSLGPGRGREIYLRRPDGSTLPIDGAASRVQVRGRDLVLAVLSDATGRIRSAELLERRARMQATIARLGELALSGLAIEQLSQRLTEALAAELDVEMCKVLELTKDGQSLRLLAGVGWAPGLVGTAQVGAGSESQAGYTLQAEQPVVVEDLRTESRFSGPALLWDHGVVSGVSVMIRGGLRPYGVLGAHTRERRSFAPEDVTFVMSASNVLAQAVQRKAAEEQLVVSDRMASIGMLAAGVAHEVNNPMAAVIGNLDLALARVSGADGESTPPSELGELGELGELLELLDEARVAAERVRHIVRDLKLFSRSEDEGQRSVDLRRVIDASARVVANEIRHRARLVCDYQETATVRANEARLGQVFLNLLVNAANAIPEGHADDNEIRVRTRDRAGWVEVEVSDTGRGIAPEHLAQLFTPFFTTKVAGEGTGLGLSICQRIVTSLGGEIRVRSELGRGATFEVRLPASTAAVSVPSPVSEARVPSTRRGRVLVIDDEPILTALIRRVLSREHDVTVEHDGRLAIERVRRGERFDVIICDLMMPAVTGYEIHEAFTAWAPDQAERMIFASGGAFTERAREFFDQVSNPTIEKPFDVARLRALVAERCAG